MTSLLMSMRESIDAQPGRDSFEQLKSKARLSVYGRGNGGVTPSHTKGRKVGGYIRRFCYGRYDLKAGWTCRRAHRNLQQTSGNGCRVPFQAFYFPYSGEHIIGSDCASDFVQKLPIRH